MRMERTQERRGDRSVELRVAANVQNIAVVRTLVGAVGTYEDLDVDSVADLRLAVDEACTQLIRAAIVNATMVVIVEPHEDGVAVEICVACQRDSQVMAPGSFSWHVLTSLVDDVQTFHDAQQTGEVVRLVLIRHRVETG